MYSLLLDRQHSQDVSVEVEALIVGQDDLVAFKGPGVTQSACVKVDDMERVVFQRRPRVRSHRLVVAIHLVENETWIKQVYEVNFCYSVFFEFPSRSAVSLMRSLPQRNMVAAPLGRTQPIQQ